jgi:peptidoglycan/xylan/chitin deacetylase (PgdA/CDA1 family)
MVLASVVSGSTGLRRMFGRGPVVRVLTYHRFGDAHRDPWCVDAAAFEAQMKWLAQQRLAVSLDDIERFVRGEHDLPHGAVLVTMDDGFSSVLHIAAPIMRKYGIPSVAYVTTGFVGTVSASGERYLTWDEVAALPAAGVTVGSHAHTHRSMARIAAGRGHGRGGAFQATAGAAPGPTGAFVRLPVRHEAGREPGHGRDALRRRLQHGVHRPSMAR